METPTAHLKGNPYEPEEVNSHVSDDAWIQAQATLALAYEQRTASMATLLGAMVARNSDGEELDTLTKLVFRRLGTGGAQ